MSKTTVTVDWEAAMALRDIKNAMSQEAGRVIPLSDVVQRLADWYRSDDGLARAELEKVNAILREHGFEYPLGARGVHDMAMQRAGFLEELNELEQKNG